MLWWAMIKIASAVALSLALSCGLVLTACSSSSDPSSNGSSAGDGGAAGTPDTSGGASGSSSSGGSTSGGATPTGGADTGGSADTSAGDSSVGGTGAAGTSTLPVGPAICAYSVSGALTDPTTDAPYGCGNGHVEQANGAGDFTASIGAAFMDEAGNLVALACTLSSATPPSAGAIWELSKDPHATGNCQLTSTKGTTATLWSASSTESTLSGSATITFKSATLIKSTYHPKDIFYVYDVSIDATLPALTPDTADVTISGTFQNTVLPLGS